MTIYDLTQALKRYWKAVTVAFAVLVLLVVAMTFTIEDGSPTFRAALKYDSAVQIAVVEPGRVSLISSGDGTGDLVGAAGLYASLLGSDEAARWIGEQQGYVLESAVNATTGRDSTVITARVQGPTPEQATGAALSTFAWLNKKLQEPVETANFPSPPTTIAVVILDSAFSSFVDVGIDAGLVGVDEGIFLFVDSGGLNPMSISLQRSAATTVRSRATLQPLTTVVLTITTSEDVVLDTIRLAPEPAPSVVDVLPELRVVLGDDAVRKVTVPGDATTGEATTETWIFDGSEISLSWVEGTVPIVPPDSAFDETIDFDLALLTPVPGFTSSGGRRGPILAVSALLIGMVLILSAVIVTDTWKTERDSRSISHRKLVFPLEQLDKAAPAPEVAEQITNDPEARTASIES